MSIASRPESREMQSGYQLSPIRILLIADDTRASQAIRALLARTLLAVELEVVHSLAESAKRERAQNHDIILLTLALEDSEGIETLVATKAALVDIPILVFGEVQVVRDLVKGPDRISKLPAPVIPPVLAHSPPTAPKGRLELRWLCANSSPSYYDRDRSEDHSSR